MQSEIIDDSFFAALAEFMSWMNGPRKDVRDVESGHLLTRVATATPEDVQEAFLKARTSQEVWRSMRAFGRSKVFARFANSLWRYQEEITAVSQMLGGKSRFDANEELLDIVSTVRMVTKYSMKMFKRRRGGGGLPFSSWRVIHRPLGTVGIFTSPDWSLSSLCDVIQALAAGNAVMNFVTPQSALGAVLLHAMLTDAGMPYGLWKIIPASTSEPGRSIIPGLDIVSVLGSDRLGYRISKSCEAAGVPFKGFLGVENVGVIMDDCKLDHAVRAIARAGFQGAGQTVTSTEAIFVHEDIFAEFSSQLKDFVEDQVTIGALQDINTTLGSMLNVERARTLQKKVDEALELGAHLLTGGHRRPDIGEAFFEPTILTDISKDSNIYNEEVHGPLIYLIPFSDLSEVAGYLGASRHIYTVYLFTRSEPIMTDFIASVEASALVINDSYMSLYSVWQAPIQGGKDTGSGIRHGVESILQYSRIQSLSRQLFHPWVSDTLTPDNRVDFNRFRIERLMLWIYTYFTDTPPAYAIRGAIRRLKYRLSGPV